MTNAEQDIKIAQTKQEVDDFKAIIKNFIGEMRDRDNKRDADIKEIRKQREEDRKQHEADMKEVQKKQDAVANELRAETNALRTEIRDGIRHIQSLTIAAIVGIVAIAVAIIAFVFVTWQSIDQSIDRKIDQRFQYLPPAQTQNYSPPQNQTQ